MLEHTIYNLFNPGPAKPGYCPTFANCVDPDQLASFYKKKNNSFFFLFEERKRRENLIWGSDGNDWHVVSKSEKNF